MLIDGDLLFSPSPTWGGAIIMALFGLVWGSFVTMASYRLPRGEDWVRKRSHCPHCQHPLHFIDLLPLVSWLSTRGTCRYCHVPVSWRYPLTEAVLALVFILVYSQFGLTLQALILSLVAVCLMIIFVADLEHYIIPDVMQWVLAMLAFPYAFVQHKEIAPLLAGACIGAATGLLLRVACSAWKKREALGWGDVKFLAVVGLYLGVAPLPAFFFLSGIAGMLTALLWAMLGRGKLFPFAPALIVALMLLLLFPEIEAQFITRMTSFTRNFISS